MIVTMAGCGALGSLLAARLIEGGAQVQAFQRKGPQFDALKKNGITIEGDRTGTTRNFKLLAVSDDPSGLRLSGLIIVLVKSYSTEGIHLVQRILEENGVVLTLQNGLGNPEKLVRMFGDERVGAGVATYGAFTMGPGVIGWGGDGNIILGPWKKGKDILWVRDFLNDRGLKVTYVEDPRPAIWWKLTINAMVNTTSALTRMRNGEMLTNPMALEMMKRLGKEAVVAAGRAGVALDFDELWSKNIENLERSAANKPSMLQDIEAGRQTEIDAITGGVLKYSRDEEEFPYTRSVYALLKAINTHRGY